MREAYNIQGCKRGDRTVGGAEALKGMQTWNAARRSRDPINPTVGGLSAESKPPLAEKPAAVAGTLAAGRRGSRRRGGSRGVPRETMIPADRTTRPAPNVAQDEWGRVRCRSSIE